jgi:hypothetical protein
MKNKLNFSLLAILMAGATALTSCSKDDGGSTPEIEVPVSADANLTSCI